MNIHVQMIQVHQRLDALEAQNRELRERLDRLEARRNRLPKADYDTSTLQHPNLRT